MPMTDLQGHYDRKYHHEAATSEVTPIDIVRYPANRFEAAVKFIPRYVKGGSILELGAGNGAVAKTLLQLTDKIDAYTLGDISIPRIKGISETIKDGRVRVQRIDAEQIPVDGQNQYDAVIMIALLEHLIDPLRVMRNVRHLLKTGGIVYIDTPNIAKYTRRALLLRGCFPSTASKNEGLTTYENLPVDLYDEGHLHYFTYRSLSNMLTNRCGFSRVEKLSYPSGRLLLGKHVETLLASLWPEAFSEVVIVAHV